MPDTLTRSYQWRITKDLLVDDYGGPAKYSRVGVTGPHNPDPKLDALDAEQFAKHDTAVRFRMLDDDRNVYYEGVIAGTFEGFEPLDDFGTPDAGAVIIEMWEKDPKTNGWKWRIL